jgi:hypothetical protein
MDVPADCSLRKTEHTWEDLPENSLYEVLESSHRARRALDKEGEALVDFSVQHQMRCRSRTSNPLESICSISGLSSLSPFPMSRIGLWKRVFLRLVQIR